MTARTIIRLVSTTALLLAPALALTGTAAAAEPATTAVVIDGHANDWANYPVIATDRAGDQVPGSPDLREVRAFSNDKYFYLLLTLYEDGQTDHYDILMDINGGQPDYQISVWPRQNKAVFAPFPPQGHMDPIATVTTAQAEAIEVRLPLSAIGGKPVQRLFVQTFLGDRDGDRMENLVAQTVDEVESTPPVTTAIIIDGHANEWANYPVIATDPAGDQIPGSPDLREVRAFDNDSYFYVLVTLYQDGQTHHYDIVMDVDGGEPDYLLSVEPRRGDNMFHELAKGVQHHLATATAAQNDAIEVRIPLAALGGKPVKRVTVQTQLGNQLGDLMVNLPVPVVNEVEPTIVAGAPPAASEPPAANEPPAAAPPPAASGPPVNVTKSGVVRRDETWRDEIHLTGDIVVPPRVTLTIEPGTTVYLAANSDDQHQGQAAPVRPGSKREDPVSTAKWEQNAISIDAFGGVLHAVGTADQPITFRPEGDSTSTAQWDGIRIGRGTLQHANLLYAGRTAISVGGESNDRVEIAYNEMRYFMRIGINADKKNVWIHNNIIEGGAFQGIAAYYDALIENNIVTHAQDGIFIGMAYGAIVRNNIVVDTSRGIVLQDGRTAEVRNNTVVRVKGPPKGWYYQGKLVYTSFDNGGGIDCFVHGPVSIVNNIVRGRFHWGLGLHIPVEAGSQVDYNLTSLTKRRYGGPRAGLRALGKHNLRANPRFVDNAKGDFHLAKRSPGINKGTPDYIDADRSRSDLGAYGGPQGDSW